MIINKVDTVCVMLLVLMVGLLGMGVYKIVFAEPVVVVGEIPPPAACVIGYGDTLWAIANRYYPGQHTGRVVELIRDLNPDLDPGRLQVGQWIDLPQEV